MFKPTYLYIKTHTGTGLKYFGKTTKNPHNYFGSGTRWLRHLSKHGKNVKTEILGFFTNKEECLRVAIEFSKINNIVESSEWANLRIESLDGGDTSKTENFQIAMLVLRELNKKRKWWNNGINQTFTESPLNSTYVRGRLPFNNLGSKKGAAIQKGKFWINNGVDECMTELDIPPGFTRGRLLDKAFNGDQGKHTIGTNWWNNGIKSAMRKECPGPGWMRGRLNPSTN